MRSPTFSVVVNTYNRLLLLKRTIDALRRLRYDNFELVVVDGPSTDGTGKWLQRNARDCKLVHIGEQNLAKSRNAGIAAAAGELVAFVDDDAIPESSWLNELAHAFHNPETVAAGGYVFDPSGYRLQIKWPLADRHGQSDDENAGIFPWSAGAFEFYYATGGNCAFRRSALMDVGGFDEAYRYYLEETDLQLRLMDRGGHLALRPFAWVHHKFAASDLRDDAAKIAPAGMEQIAYSCGYFIFQANRDGTGLCPAFHDLSKASRQSMQRWISIAGSYYRNKRITRAEMIEYRSRIEAGFSKGIEDALVCDKRRVRTRDYFADPARFKSMPALLAQRKRLRIALLTPLFPPDLCGGIGVFKHRLAQELARRGHEISVFTQVEGGRTRVDFEEGFWVHRIAADSGRRHNAIPGDMPDNLAVKASAVHDEIFRVLPVRQFDYAIASIWDLDSAALIASGLVPVGLYLTTSMSQVAEFEEDWQPGSAHYQQHVKPMMAMERWALEHADRVLAPTHQIADDIADIHGIDFSARRCIVPFGLEDRKTSRRRPAAPLRVLFVGRLEKRKGADILLAALPELLAHFPSAEFHLVGRDNEGHEQAFSARNGTQWSARVIFHGVVEDDDLHQHYADGDVFVAPSRYESFGLIYLEAMRYALPVIALRRGGVPSLVQHEHSGLLLDTEKPEDLAAAIGALLANAQLRSAYGRAGQAKYLEKYTVSAYADRMEAFLYDRLGRAEPSPVNSAYMSVQTGEPGPQDLPGPSSQ